MDVLNGLLDNAFSFLGATCHCIGFATSRRPERKYRAVFALKHFFHKLGDWGINFLLGSLLIVDDLKYEALNVLTFSDADELGLILVNRIAENFVQPMETLPVMHVSHTQVNLYRLQCCV